MVEELEDQADLAVRLRVALSLCPNDALTHRRSDRVSRREKIRRHLVTESLVPRDLVERLAEAIELALDAWQEKREDVTSFRSQLIARDGNRCGACAVDFALAGDEISAARERDPFKLGWVSPSRHYFPTVDHREPVSKFGTNELSNLWLLCRFCNEGKGDGAPLLLKHELEYATALPWVGTGMPEAHLVAYSGRLTFRVLARDGFTCVMCSTSQSELTIRKDRERGLAVLSNLVSICIDCETQTRP